MYAFMDDVALVVSNVQEAKATLQTIQDIGSILGLVINTRKTKVHHWSPQPSAEPIEFHGVTVPVLPAVAQYLGHLLAHKSLRLSVEQEILEAVIADLKSYEDLPLTAWERAELVSTTLLPKLCYKWLMVLSHTTMYAIDKKSRHFITNTPGMCPKRDVTEVVTTKKLGGMGLHQVYWMWRTTTVSRVQSMLRKQLCERESIGMLSLYHEVVTRLLAKVPH